MSSETGNDACNGNVTGGIRATIENHTGFEGGPARI